MIQNNTTMYKQISKNNILYKGLKPSIVCVKIIK